MNKFILITLLVLAGCSGRTYQVEFIDKPDSSPVPAQESKKVSMKK